MNGLSNPLKKILITLLYCVVVGFSSTAAAAADNSAALESIDREIVAKQQRLAEGVKLHRQLKSKTPKVREAAQAMMDAEQELAKLEDKARNNYQNNALKIQIQLGIAIALLAPTALMPADNFIDAAATGVSMFVVDPIMNEIGTWMGVGDPMAAKRKTLQTYAEGTFPSQSRLEFWLAEQPTENASVLDRDRQIIQYSKQGRKEVSNARRDLIALYQNSQQLLKSMESEIEKLKREIETLERHRRATAGEDVGPPAATAEIPAEIGPRTVNAVPVPGVTNINEIIRELKILRQNIQSVRQQLITARKGVAEKIQNLVVEMDGRATQIDKSKAAKEKNFYANNPPFASIDSLKNYCAPTSIPFSQAIANRNNLHTGGISIESSYLSELGQMPGYYESATNQIEHFTEVKLITEKYGHYRSLIDAHESLQKRAISQLTSRNEYVDIRAEQAHYYFALINDARAEMAQKALGAQRKTNRVRSDLETQKSLWKTIQPQLSVLAQECTKSVRFSLEYQLKQAQLGKYGRQNYTKAAQALEQAYQQLAAQGILEPENSDESRYSVQDAWLKKQAGSNDGICTAVARIRQHLQPAAAKLEILRDNAASAREMVTDIKVHLGSNPIAEQNLPDLHSQIMAQVAQIKTERRQFDQAEQILQTSSNLPWMVKQFDREDLAIFKVFDSKSETLKALAERQAQEVINQNGRSKILLAEVESAQSQNRIADTSLPRYRKMLKELQDDYTQQLECLRDDHPAKQSIVETLSKLQAAIDKLVGKATYLDVSANIAILRNLKTAIRNLPLGEDEDYKKKVADFDQTYNKTDSWFDVNKTKMTSSDSEQIGQFLYDISLQLPVHFEHLISLDSIVGNSRIIAFYDNFSQAYEAKNESQVMSYIHDDWNAAGSITLYDLEDNLRNMYNVFDDIQYSISGLSFSKAGDNLYNIRYSVTIRGQIYDNDLIHEEVSAVTEQVIIDSSGTVKIYKTLGGNYWSIQ